MPITTRKQSSKTFAAIEATWTSWLYPSTPIWNLWKTPSVERKSISHRLAESGATLILEHHPHVPQGVEMVGKSLIAYSLGDFCFPAYTDAYMYRHLPNTARTFVLLVEVSKDGVDSFSRVPCRIMPPLQQRPMPLTGEEKDQMLVYLEKLDTMVRDDDIVRRNWHTITTKRLESAYHAIQAAPSLEAAKYLLGRWIFVEENLGWVRQAYGMMKEDWEKQGERVDLYHRPSCAFSAFERPKRGILKRVIVAVRRLVSRLKRWYFVRKQ